ncbi:MAG: FumA C-terminus/TtdB family hydratase beta subunit [Sphaerochaetaceae bacterium]|nr:FumA C-terminus/TtdB family hydratase beta subunit [Sphaerochaetaceae bacterium]MDC7250647.1 FumA C-terminus/TtdB family hydratase beta subunit [Sphaerochaetaceae bacterium]
MINLELPLTKDIIKSLEIFDEVRLNGELYVARDQAHKEMFSLLDNNKDLPFAIKDQAIYYMGPSPAPNNFIIGSCGPTTSARMDAFSPRLLDLGLNVMIGKGPRNKDVINSIIKNKSIYLAAFGGCGALYNSKIKKVETIAFDYLGPEALLKLTVEDFPCIVAIDSRGNSVY